MSDNLFERKPYPMNSNLSMSPDPFPFSNEYEGDWKLIDAHGVQLGNGHGKLTAKDAKVLAKTFESYKLLQKLFGVAKENTGSTIGKKGLMEEISKHLESLK